MKVELPELPEAAIKTAHPAANAFSYGYHADQMTDYARLAVTQAVAAERARAEMAEAERDAMRAVIDKVLEDESGFMLLARIASTELRKVNELVCAALTKKD